MEKVKLTREQAEAIEKKKSTGSAAVAKHLEGWTWKENKCLNDLSMEQFVKALYIGYEVEETFKVGDWVKDTSTNAVIKIKDRQHRNNINDPRYSTVRHATPEEIAEEKQRRWWAKHGREVWELRKGDVIKKLCSPFEFEAWEITDIDDHYIYAKDSRMIHPKTTKMDANYKVICFAEDRKDVK